MIKKLTFVFSRHEKIRLLIIMFLMVGGSVLETGAVYVMLPFVTAIMDVDSILDTTWMAWIYRFLGLTNKMQLVAVLAFGITFLYIFKALYQYIVVYISQSYLSRERARVSRRLLYIQMNKPYSYHVHTNTATIQRIAVSDVDKLFGSLSAVFTMVMNLFTAVMLLVVLLVTNIWLTLGSVALIVIIVLIINVFLAKKMKEVGKKNAICWAEQVKAINQASGGLKEIYVNRRQDYFVGIYAGLANEYAELQKVFQTMAEISRQSVQAIVLASIFFTAGVVSLQGLNFTAMLPVLATFCMAAYRLVPVVNAVNTSMNTIRHNSFSVDYIYDELKSEIQRRCSEKDSNYEEELPFKERLEEGISIQNLSFRFDDSDEWLYKNLSLEIPAQSSVAFVGTTGSGKTTLADIILGIQIPMDGHILADGHDIHVFKNWWAKEVGYIPQQIYLCDDDIRANVAFGIESSQINEEKIWRCLEQAQMKSFVEGLPEGLDTNIGENGVRLSGGQRQRIGIARALYNNPPFLVMDEATSALDGETEKAIIESFNKLSHTKTIMIIAHRLTTIESCDIVYRVENGNIKKIRGGRTDE